MTQRGEEAGSSPNVKATIYDVAKVAGVFPSTVSRAFSQPGRVSFNTAEKVRLAAAQVGYGKDVETVGETTLSQPKSGIIAMVAADVSNPFLWKFFGVLNMQQPPRDIRWCSSIPMNQHANPERQLNANFPTLMDSCLQHRA